MTNLNLFSPIISKFDRRTFKHIVSNKLIDRHQKGYDSWTHLVSMLFCQFAKNQSVRDISNGLRSATGRLNHLGIEKAPSKWTVSYQRVVGSFRGARSYFVPTFDYRCIGIRLNVGGLYIEEENLLEDQQLGKKQTILIVEDNKALQEQLLSCLSTRCQVYIATNGEEGMRNAMKIILDLIISDITMPVMNGIEMLKQVKEKEETCHIPIILLTAKNLVEDQVKGYKTGADAYVSKPFYMDLLITRVESILTNRKILKECFNKRPFQLTEKPIKDIKPKDEFFIDKAADIVMKHIDEVEFLVKNVYKEMGVSSTHFYNKTSQLSGYNPSQFIRNICLKMGQSF